MTGGCSCGAIRYEIASFPLLLYSCNCTDCQNRSGSAFALNMPVAASGFRIVQGEPTAWRHVSPSGVPVISWFCGDCGGRLYGERAGRAEIVNVRAGTLDDTSWLVPSAHFFTRSQRAGLGPTGGGRHLFRDPAGGMGRIVARLAGSLAGIFQQKIVAKGCGTLCARLGLVRVEGVV
jgi:hypothetical protein